MRDMEEMEDELERWRRREKDGGKRRNGREMS